MLGKRSLDIQQQIEKGISILRQGGIVAFPTDTIYGLGACADLRPAVERVYKVKERPRNMALPLLLADTSQISEVASYVPPVAWLLARNFLPGALTLVLPKKEVVPSLLVAGHDTVGIRIPDHKVMLDLAALTELPITATSANVSGQPTPYSVPEVINLLGGAMEQVALILDQGPILSRGLSTIVDLTVSPPQLLRQGLVSWLEIRQVLQALQDSASEQE